MSQGRLPLLSEMGGISVLAENSSELSESPFLDVLCLVAEECSPSDAEKIDEIVVCGIALTQSPLVFRDAVDGILARTTLTSDLIRSFASTLTDRVEARRTGGPPLIAAYALEGLLRTAIEEIVSKHRVLAMLAEVGEPEDGEFARHAAKLAGVAFQLWNVPEVLETLERLSRIGPSADEALTELGLCHLKRAFSESDREAVNKELRVAREFLREATHDNAEREDATAYRSAIDIVLGFASDAPLGETEQHARDLTSSVSRWLAWRERELLPAWLRAREDIDLQWTALVSEVSVIAAKLARPSWLNASAVLERILAVYDAERCISAGPGFKSIIRPRIEAAFLHTSGLRAHLDDALDSGVFGPISADVALCLRERIRAFAIGAPPRKAEEDDRYPRLAVVLESQQTIESLPSGVASQIESNLADFELTQENICHPIVQQLIREVRSVLATSAYYNGEIKAEFDRLLVQVICFCKDRLDASRKERGERGRYLYDPHATEWQLQSDLRDFLHGNCTWADVRTEVEGVGVGRCDLYVSCARQRRYIIELKREFQDCSSSGLRKYLAQSTAYQGTNIPLGLLGVLDLTSRSGPAAHLATNIWAETCESSAGDKRYVVIFRVPGNLVTPSSFSQ
jgi:hypothetical protein